MAPKLASSFSHRWNSCSGLYVSRRTFTKDGFRRASPRRLEFVFPAGNSPTRVKKTPRYYVSEYILAFLREYGVKFILSWQADSVGIVVRVGEEPLSKLSTGLPVWEPKPKPFNVHQIVYSWRQYDVGQVEVHSGIFETFEWLEPNHVISIGHSEEKLYQKKM